MPTRAKEAIVNLPQSYLSQYGTVIGFLSFSEIKWDERVYPFMH